MAKRIVVLKISDLSKSYHQGEKTLDVLKGVNLEVKQGEIIALVGQSGSGKSTLLHCLGLLDQADSGLIELDGQDCTSASDMLRTQIRRDKISFIYQFHHLQPEFSALENVMLPQIIKGVSKKEAKAKASELLSSLGLEERLHHRPSDLSGGEQQRVAIARALINDPKILLADEPTGNLDPETSARVFDALLSTAKQKGACVILATHNLDLAAKTDRQVSLKEGMLVA